MFYLSFSHKIPKILRFLAKQIQFLQENVYFCSQIATK